MRDNGTQPTRRTPPPLQSGPRAKDFVKCVDRTQCPYPQGIAMPDRPHCHPVYS